MSRRMTGNLQDFASRVMSSGTAYRLVVDDRLLRLYVEDHRENVPPDHMADILGDILGQQVAVEFENGEVIRLSAPERVSENPAIIPGIDSLDANRSLPPTWPCVACGSPLLDDRSVGTILPTETGCRRVTTHVSCEPFDLWSAEFDAATWLVDDDDLIGLF